MKQLVFFNSLLIVFLVLTPLLLPLAEAGDPLITAGFCEEKCKVRCAKASVQDRCLKYCQICCLECKCVPSGTYGNKHECACYRDKKNSKGKPKCP